MLLQHVWVSDREREEEKGVLKGQIEEMKKQKQGIRKQSF